MSSLENPKTANIRNFTRVLCEMKDTNTFHFAFLKDGMYRISDNYYRDEDIAGVVDISTLRETFDYIQRAGKEILKQTKFLKNQTLAIRDILFLLNLQITDKSIFKDILLFLDEFLEDCIGIGDFDIVKKLPETNVVKSESDNKLIHYIKQTTGGGITGDTFNGICYVPITTEEILIKFNYWC